MPACCNTEPDTVMWCLYGRCGVSCLLKDNNGRVTQRKDLIKYYKTPEK